MSIEERPRPCVTPSYRPGVQISALLLISLVYGSLTLNCIINAPCISRNTPAHGTTGRTQIRM